MNKYIFTTSVIAVLLSGCALQPNPLFYKEESDTNSTQGIYLVEEPYQIKDVWYFPAEKYDYSEQGLASWYIPSGENNLTANGEQYDAHLATARHKTLPLPSIVKITNLENNKTVIARVNDRGPMVNNRLIDVSQKAAEQLEMPSSGAAMVQVEVLPEESKQAKLQLLNKNPIYQPEQTTQQNDNELVLIAPDTTQSDFVAPTAQTEVLYAPEKAQIQPVQIGESKIVLGSFANVDNAQRLQKQLSNTYSVQIEQVQRQGKLLNVVQVGPYSKEEAKTILNQFKERGYKDAYIKQ